MEAPFIFQVLAIDTVGAVKCSCSTSLVEESRKMFSSDELDLHFDDVGDVYREVGLATGKDEKDSFEFGLGGGDGVLL